MSPQPVGQPGPNAGSDAWLKLHAGGDIDALLIDSITRDTNDVPLSATVDWPDGSSGVFTALVINSTFNVLDSYSLTYFASDGQIRTVTQPTVTRNANGTVITRPRMVVT